jgi:1,4-alpha-glucan branching enzyme
MLKKKFLKSKPVCKVTFSLPAEAVVTAETVKIVGDFNEWNAEEATEMKSLKKGGFKAVLDLETGKDYQFRYLVDGEKWENDWAADDYIANEYGEDNSVVTLTEAQAN